MDIAHKETDELIAKLEKRINKVYSQAAKETQAKLDKHMSAFAEKDKIKREKLQAGEISLQEYNHWRTGQIMVGKRWEEMVDTLSTDLANADKLAQSMVDGYMYDAYALNHNYATFLVEQESLVDTSYTLYDRQTVERLIKDRPALLPKPSDRVAQDIKDKKIKRWSKQKIASEVTQGILQGESVNKIAARMRNVTDMGMRASVRNARTAVTGAENAGRQAGFERAQDMGIDTEKQWLATMDDRTRHEHRLLDGVHVPVDDDFEVEGYKIQYPGDPSAEPEMVYNCRCTMICRIKGFEKDFTDRHNDALGDMTYDEWKGAHTNSAQEPEEEPVKEFTKDDADAMYKQLEGQDIGQYEEDMEKWLKTITEEEKKGVVTYTGSAYIPMNNYLRGINKDTSDRYKDAIQNCTKALEKASLPNEQIVRRGVDAKGLGFFVGDMDAFEKIKKGTFTATQPASDKGFLSTSPDPYGGFSKPAEVIIKLPKGAKAIYVDPISRNQGENETLVQRNSQFNVLYTEFSKKDRRVRVYCEWAGCDV